MKAVICLCLVALVAAVAVAHPDGKYYDTTKYESINMDETLPNDHLRKPYVLCALEVITNCTPAAKDLKSHIKEALEDGCAKCSEKHIAAIKKVIAYLINNKPEEWEQLCAKYDPENKYSKKYEEELKEVKQSHY